MDTINKAYTPRQGGVEETPKRQGRERKEKTGSYPRAANQQYNTKSHSPGPELQHVQEVRRSEKETKRSAEQEETGMRERTCSPRHGKEDSSTVRNGVEEHQEPRVGRRPAEKKEKGHMP